MTEPVERTIEAYLRQLEVALRAQGRAPDDIVDEVGDHLMEVAAGALRRAEDPHAACAAAIGRLGPPAALTVRFILATEPPMTRFLLPLSVLLGLAIAWIDSRPAWDDAGITAGALFLTSAALGFAVPKRAWLWALGVGIWLPLHAIVAGGHWDMLVTLAFPLVGAGAGFGLRKTVTAISRAG